MTLNWHLICDNASCFRRNQSTQGFTKLITMPNTSIFLWFNNQAEEAAKLYTSLFDNSRIKNSVLVPGAGPEGKETLQLVEFEINGQPYTAFNGGPHHTFNEAVSIVVHCDTQEEIDRYWDRLTADGGSEIVCGWLKDKFGLCWQIVPSILPKLMSKGDMQRSASMMQALHTMKKLDIAKLQEAYDQGVPQPA
jgi:predicted 3-demethylubiquinone-9 3-methyltransferase (glyoxalase superfamily)